MTDLALRFDPKTGRCDLAIVGGQLAIDDGLETACLVSLFTDARASADDGLPYAGADRRGWWGDAFARDDGDGTGSKLWLLAREKALPATLAKARVAAEAATSWLKIDGIAASIEATAERLTARDAATATLAIGVSIVRPSGPARERFDFVWAATGAGR